MINIKEMITSNGLKIVDKKKVSESLELFLADYRVGDKVICKYIIISGDSNSYRENIVNKESYRNFEENYIEPIFYNLIGDLSWNLYLIYVLSDSEYKKLSIDEKVEFEKDERYARKVVVSEEAFLKYIPVGKIVKGKSNSNYIVDPITEWMSVLESNNMSFCFEPYSKNCIQSFLNGTFQPEISLGTSYDSVNSIFGNDPIKIKSLNINGNFRKHCFESNIKFEFGDVNLFSGSNGSGKTSILEAVELIMTGEIRKNNKGSVEGELYKNDLYSKSTIKLTNGIDIQIPYDSREKKERECELYQNRQKKKDNLNGGFHQYNYYTFEDTYIFCFLGQQPDYNEEFSRIIFGESTKSIEKNWVRYKEVFKKEIDSIEKDFVYLNNEIELLGEIDNSNIQFSLLPMYELLKNINITIEKVDNESNFESISDWLTKLHTKLLNIKMLLENYITQSNGIDSKFRLNQVYESEHSNLVDTERLMYFTDIKVSEIQTICNKISEQKEDVDAKSKYLSSIIGSVREDLQIFNSYSLVYDNIEKCNLLLNYESDRKSLEQKIYSLSCFKERWEQLLDCTALDISVADLKKQLETLYISRNELNERFDKIARQIEFEESKSESISKVISQVKVLGKKYLDESANSLECPLCSTRFASRLEFMHAIEKELFVDDSNYKKLLEQRNLFYQELDNKNRHINICEKQQEFLKEMLNAVDFIIENNLIPLDESLKSDSALKIKEKISSVIKLYQEESNNIKKLNLKISNMEVSGIKLSTVKEALDYINLKTESNDKSLEGNKIVDIKNNYENQITNYTSEISSLNTELKKLNDDLNIELEKFKKENVTKQNLQAKLQSIEETIQNLDVLNEHIKEIEEYNIVIDSEMSISKVKNCLQTILEENVKLSEKVAKVINTKVKLTKLTSIKNDICLKEKMKIRCEEALNILNSLKLSEQYADEFIRNNISDISNLFVSLHSPREFDKLDLNANNEIVGFRKADNTDIEVPILMMSSGQRTAVVLSIFIKLHLSMKTVPKFILLDEPVSNIDDLNIVGLLDFLREMVISNGTQLFFTTANHNVAKLFKHKFSFMREGFSEFKFIRLGNTKSKVLKYTYKEFHDDKATETLIT